MACQFNYLILIKLANLLAKAGVTDKSKVLVYSEGNNVLGSSQIAYALDGLDGGLCFRRSRLLTQRSCGSSQPP